MMPIPFDQNEDGERFLVSGNIVYLPLREWDQDGHHVAWLRYVGQDPNNPFSGEDLYCECDFVYEERTRITDDGEEISYRVHTVDSYKCPAKKAVRDKLKDEARRRHGRSWKKLGPKEAVFDIFRRIQAKEHLGQHHAGMIYVQEVAELLRLSEYEVWKICDELFVEEKLDLNGAILCPYVPRFRFPKELQALFAYIVEEPLGWPNGEAGDCFLYDLEEKVEEKSGFKHGKDAFGDENYPHLAPRNLLRWGLYWLEQAISRAEAGGEDREDLSYVNFEKLAGDLHKHAEALSRMDSEPTMVRWDNALDPHIWPKPLPPTLPVEIAELLACLGDFGLDEVVEEIAKESKHPLFYEHNTPRLKTHYVLMFGERWLHLALYYAKASKEAQRDLDSLGFAKVAERLNKLSERAKKLAAS